VLMQIGYLSARMLPGRPLQSRCHPRTTH
jgi:hypothetical protein